MMKRTYTDVSDFRAPYDSPNLSFSGLGDHEPLVARRWPRGRSYQDVSDFRAPYDRGYYQDNTLMGLGDAAGVAEDLPPEFRRYLMTGAQMGTTLRDVRAAASQIPRCVWAGLMLLGLGGAYWTYRKANKRS
jgi:hypothetical protein